MEDIPGIPDELRMRADPSSGLDHGQLARSLWSIQRKYDASTALHAARVAKYARLTARKMGLADAEIGVLNTAALLHDIGKMAIEESVVYKKGPLDYAERAQMRRHPAMAVDFLRMFDLPAGVLDIIEYHHERYDGRGYPCGLKGSEIPPGARILAVADSYDAMTSFRPYHMPLGVDRAMDELNGYAGAQWDPQIVPSFTSIVGTWWHYKGAGFRCPALGAGVNDFTHEQDGI